jgi:hypothetical protein
VTPVQANGLAPEEVYFVDIGANVGTFTFSAAAHGFKVGQTFLKHTPFKPSVCGPLTVEQLSIFDRVLLEPALVAAWLPLVRC